MPSPTIVQRVASRRILWTALFILALPCAEARAAGAVDAGSPIFRHAEAGYQYDFPRDHGSHDGYRTEWWYYTGHLYTPDGREFGFELTFFRRGVDRRAASSHPSRWAIRHLYLAHAALTDVSGKRFLYDEKISRAGLGKAGADTDHLRTWIDNWSVEGGPTASSSHRLCAATSEFALDLTAEPTHDPVIHGAEGISRKGTERTQASHYYSYTRMATAGVVTLDGARYNVTGSTWMDHEFGSGDLGADQVGWDWFSIQLAGGGDVMVYRLRRSDGQPDRASSGTLIDATDTQYALSVDDVSVIALSSWTSPRSGATYPSGWSITIPSASLMLTLVPQLREQELVTTRSTQVTYWEGSVAVEGTWHRHPVTGRGYVELTGYASPFGTHQ